MAFWFMTAEICLGFGSRMLDGRSGQGYIHAEFEQRGILAIVPRGRFERARDRPYRPGSVLAARVPAVQIG